MLYYTLYKLGHIAMKKNNNEKILKLDLLKLHK